MKFNINGKQTIVISVSALGMGAVIFLGEKAYSKIKNRKKTVKPAEEMKPVENKAEEFVK